jgi:valyl-tRNA synthetase
MSKSLGNSPDPLQLIEKFGGDGVRVGMLLCSPAGGDLLFDESLPQQGAGFATKIWNAFRLVHHWKISENTAQPDHSAIAAEWFRHKLNEVNATLADHFSKFRISDALMLVYTTFRDEFSGWLLEIVKPDQGNPIDGKTYREVICLFDSLLRLMHPFIPFITEEIWQNLQERRQGDSIMVSAMPEQEFYDVNILEAFNNVREAVSGIRKIRLDHGISFKEPVDTFVRPGEKGYEPEYLPVLEKLCNLKGIRVVSEEVTGAASFRVKSTTFSLVAASVTTTTTTQNELARIEGELNYTRGFLASVMKKLGNERFVKNAPADVVEKEKAKKADAEAKIKVLEDRLHAMQQ